MIKYAEITRNTQRAIEFFEDRVGFTVGPVELKEMLKEEGVKLIDVRKQEDYHKSHIPGSINIPGAELEKNLHQLSKENITVLYCYTQQCHLAAKGALLLARNGYPVRELEGGFKTWHVDYDFEVTTGH